MKISHYTTILLGLSFTSFHSSGQNYGPPPVVANLQTLLSSKNPASSINPYVMVAGYRTNGDWGDARKAVWVKGGIVSTNRGCDFAATGGRWHFPDCDSGEVDARWFGAIGDGVTDDTAAITSAVDSDNRTVKFPAGRYLVSAQIPLRNSVKIVGTGGHILTTVTNRFDSIFLATNRVGVSIRNIVASSATEQEVFLLRADLTRDVVVSGCTVTNIGLILTRGYVNLSLPDTLANVLNYYTNLDTSLQRGIKVTKNTAVGGGSYLSSFYAAGRIDFAEDVVVSDNKVSNYYFPIYGNGANLVWVGTNSVCYDSYAAGRTGFSTPPQSKRITFSGNVIDGCYTGPWYLGAREVALVGNVVGSSFDVGATLDACENGVISGNSIRNAVNGAIWVGAGSHNVSVVGNSVLFDADAPGLPTAIAMTMNGNMMQTNIIVSGNTFINNSGSTNSFCEISTSSSSCRDFVYKDNIHYNVRVFGRQPYIQNGLFEGNLFVQKTELYDGAALLTIPYLEEGAISVRNNQFLAEYPFATILSAATNLTLTGDYIPTTGDSVQFVGYGATIANAVDGKVYWVNAVATNIAALYDTYANATNGTSTGLVLATNIGFSRRGLYPRLVRHYGDVYGLWLLKSFSGGSNYRYIHADVSGNRFDTRKSIRLTGWPDTYSGNETNFAGFFYRKLGPIVVSVDDNTFGPNTESIAYARHDNLGGSSSLRFGRNQNWNGQTWPTSVSTNVLIGNSSFVYDASPSTSASLGWRTVSELGLWSNRLGLTNWVATNYVAGDIVFSGTRSYVCVAGGASSVDPAGSGSGDAYGYIFDGSMAWWNLGAIVPAISVPIGQAGFRTRAGTPVGFRTPNWIGEELLDTTSLQWWKANGTGTTNWSSMLLDAPVGGPWVRSNYNWVAQDLFYVNGALIRDANIFDSTQIQWGVTMGNQVYAALANTAVTPGTYSNATLTVDQKGRLTYAASGSAFGLTNTGVSAGTYTWAGGSLALDVYGRATAATNGLTPFQIVSSYIANGANVSIDTSSGTNIVISATTGGSTNGTPLYVDAAGPLATANLADSSEINPAASSTNVTFSIVANSIATNKIDSTFYGLLMATPGGAGTNIFVNSSLVSQANLKTDTGSGGVRFAVSGSDISAWVTNMQTSLAFTNGVTNSAGTVSANLAAGSSITFSTNSGQITIGAIIPTNSGTVVSVDGSIYSLLDFGDSTDINFSASGSNATASMVNNSITTNKLASSTRTFLLSRVNHTDTQPWSTLDTLPTIISRLVGIGAGASGDILYRDATGWTNLVKSSNGKVLKLMSGLPSWEDDNTSAGGYISKSVSIMSVSNSTSEELLYSWTIPADTLLSDGDELEFYVPAKYSVYTGQTAGYQWDFYIDYLQAGESSTTGNYVDAIASVSSSYAADWNIRVKRMSTNTALVMAKHTIGADNSSDMTNAVSTFRYLNHTVVNGWDQDMDFALTFTPAVANVNHGVVAYGYTVRKLQ